VTRLEEEVLEGRKNLVTLKNSLTETERERERYEGQAARVISTLEETRVQLADMQGETLATRERVERLKADLKSAEEGARRLEGGATRTPDEGDRLRAFKGQGDRQYLTDLKVGGRRILILVDASASMLGETIVDVVRRRNLPDSTKLRAPKWQRAVATVDWLATQLPVTAKFQLYAFNEAATPVVSGSAGRWLDAGAPADLNAAVDRLRGVVPGKGTSLYQAFLVVAGLSPRPDNIVLITDGLPTQGRSRGVGSTVTPGRRLQHFSTAIKGLPSGIPVNVILFPMEGDPGAAPAFWKLAQKTRGAFLSPSKDWP
jgi:hypothetical protein